MVGLLVDLRSNGLRRSGIQRAGVVPRRQGVGGAISSSGAGTGRGISPDQAHGGAVSHPGVRSARGRSDGAPQAVPQICATGSRGRILPHIFHAGRRHHGSVSVLVATAFGAVRLGVGAVAGVLLAFGRVEFACCRYGSVVG